MAIFIVKAPALGITQVVRAKCMSCAREVAVAHAQDEGTRVWRDPELSKVELVREGDRSGVILRSVE